MGSDPICANLIKRGAITINLLASIILFNLLIIIYQIIIEIFTAIFRIEGVQIDKARFQIISIITGTGFTTSESELMLATKRRRKLTQMIILFSYIFNISIVTTIVNVFISYSPQDTNLLEFEIGAGLTAINILLLIGLNKSTRIRRIFDNLAIKIATRAEKKRINPISVYDYYGSTVIAEVKILQLNNKLTKINTERLKKEFNIQLLVIKRGNETISEIEPDVLIEKNDVLLVFGNLKQIKKLFKMCK